MSLRLLLMADRNAGNFCCSDDDGTVGPVACCAGSGLISPPGSRCNDRVNIVLLQRPVRLISMQVA